MAPDGELTVSSALDRPAAEVWERAVTEEGINDELAPILRMTMPPGLRGKTVDTVEVGAELGRSWILLGRLLPVDYDDLKLVELEPGRRFLERSRTLAFVGLAARAHDRARGRGVLPGHRPAQLRAQAWRRLDPRRRPRSRQRSSGALFGHRHRRLARVTGSP